ncbi:hypothetical protein PHYPSEUDO_014087 [Phytophthora pseudosyringae]|uniref:BZIP transcription factor 1 n=1 Tax=Phytophthora pseudosyringae TaxID=221518 RepID=A0A8T1W6L2_9STRA|nr:hypothetical protein PHYPSEUDO_014087 [Phytophthora pseudosyringae]
MFDQIDAATLEAAAFLDCQFSISHGLRTSSRVNEPSTSLSYSMSFCASGPPDSSVLSDTVIGHVMQRTPWKTRGNATDLVRGGATRKETTADLAYQQRPRCHTYRHAPYQKAVPAYPIAASERPTKIPVETPKGTAILSSIADLIGQTDSSSGRKRASCLSSDLKTANEIIASIQGANHNITAELQQAIVAEALKKKIRHRERCRINQARYRQRQMKVETKIEDVIAKLQHEIDELQTKCKNSSRTPATPSTWALAFEYFRQFNVYVSSPATQHATASQFLQDMMAPNVMDGAHFGIETQLENWRQFALCFDDVHVELKGLTTPTPDTIVAGIVTSVTVSSNSLCHVFPHLNSDGVGGARGGVWSPLGTKLLGQKLAMRGSMAFGWDKTTGKVVRLQSQSDMLSPMLKLLGSLEDVTDAFAKARWLLAGTRRLGRW